MKNRYLEKIALDTEQKARLEGSAATVAVGAGGLAGISAGEGLANKYLSAEVATHKNGKRTLLGMVLPKNPTGSSTTSLSQALDPELSRLRNKSWQPSHNYGDRGMGFEDYHMAKSLQEHSQGHGSIFGDAATLQKNVEDASEKLDPRRKVYANVHGQERIDVVDRRLSRVDKMKALAAKGLEERRGAYRTAGKIGGGVLGAAVPLAAMAAYGHSKQAVEMPLKDLIKEHKDLVGVLKSNNRAGELKELKEQGAELTKLEKLAAFGVFAKGSIGDIISRTPAGSWKDYTRLVGASNNLDTAYYRAFRRNHMHFPESIPEKGYYEAQARRLADSKLVDSAIPGALNRVNTAGVHFGLERPRDIPHLTHFDLRGQT